MINLFIESKYEDHYGVFQRQMVCIWSHSGTTLTLFKLEWHRSIRATFHLLVEEASSTLAPIALGINEGWDQIDQAIDQKVAPPDLLKIILDNNPRLEELILAHSPNTQRLIFANIAGPGAFAGHGGI